MILGTVRRFLSRLLWDDEDRAIFGFWDGRRWRRVDPVVVMRAMDSHPTFRWEHAKGVDDKDDESVQIVVAATRDVFGVKALSDRDGLSETECIVLFHDFLSFMGDLKKKVSPGPTWQPSTAPQPSAASDTPSEWDCGSMFTGSELVQPPE